MRKSKEERLEAKGWRFGTAQEFLGLSDEETAYVELRLRLAESLRHRRQKAEPEPDGPREGAPFEPVARREDGGRRSFRVARPPDPITAGAWHFESRSRAGHLRCVAAEGELAARTRARRTTEEGRRQWRVCPWQPHASPASLNTAWRVSGSIRNRRCWRRSRTGASAGRRPACFALSRTPSVPVRPSFRIRAYWRARASSRITRESSVSVPRARTSLSPAPRSATIGRSAGQQAAGFVSSPAPRRREGPRRAACPRGVRRRRLSGS